MSPIIAWTIMVLPFWTLLSSPSDASRKSPPIMISPIATVPIICDKKLIIISKKAIIGELFSSFK